MLFEEIGNSFGVKIKTVIITPSETGGYSLATPTEFIMY
jgi:hypothetical protein